MKILLIYPTCLEPRIQDEDVRVVPIGLYYVGALLKAHGHQVEILNGYHMDPEPRKMREILLAKGPELIGFSILHANRWGGIELARLAKTLDRRVRIVFGGIGATCLWEHFLGHFEEVDFVVMGEGEYAFRDLIRCLEQGREKDLQEIPGIAFRKEGLVFRTEPSKPVQDLDELPDPARYFSFQHAVSSRGCPGHCTFCGSPSFWGRRVRYHSPAYFVRQLERLYEQGIRFFYLSDDTFTLRKDRVIEICKRIIEKRLDISWAAIARVDHVNEEILHWMRRAGCIQISYGVESGSEKIRAVLNKKIKTGQVRRAFSLTRRYGIMARAYFIYGSPGETWDTIQETLDLIREIRPLSAIFYILDLFPGTALYEDFKKRSGASDHIWLERIEDIMYFETDPALSQEMILAFGKKLREGFYRALPGFAEEIELVDKVDLYPLHADFLSRLGMTFSHGDYARIEAMEGKEETAERLFRRALQYAPDHRAYLGLGILKQKAGKHEESLDILTQGLQHFPRSAPLRISVGISHMNLGRFKEALSHLMKCQEEPDALVQMAACYRALGDQEGESAVLGRLEQLRTGRDPGQPESM